MKKSAYLKVRLPAIRKSGGAHEPAKGGKYNRKKEKKKLRKEFFSSF